MKKQKRREVCISGSWKKLLVFQTSPPQFCKHLCNSKHVCTISTKFSEAWTVRRVIIKALPPQPVVSSRERACRTIAPCTQWNQDTLLSYVCKALPPHPVELLRDKCLEKNCRVSLMTAGQEKTHLISWPMMRPLWFPLTKRINHLQVLGWSCK